MWGPLCGLEGSLPVTKAQLELERTITRHSIAIIGGCNPYKVHG